MTKLGALPSLVCVEPFEAQCGFTAEGLLSVTVPSGELVPCLGLRSGHPCRHKHGRVPRGRLGKIRIISDEQTASPEADLIILCGACKTYLELTVTRIGQAA